jgi:hypothetical protein
MSTEADPRHSRNECIRNGLEFKKLKSQLKSPQSRVASN